jgi:O-antigen/teichoic acid export membrane protein
VTAARLLGPEAYGAYAVALSLLGVAAPLVALGLPLVALRTVAAGRTAELRGLARFGPAAIAGTGLAAGLAVWLAAPLLPAAWRFGLSAELAAFAVAAAAPAALLRWWSGWVLGAGWSARGQAGEALLRPLLVLAGLGALAGLGWAASATDAIALQAGALSLAALAAAVWARRSGRDTGGAGPASAPGRPAGHPGRWLGAGLPLMAAGLLGLLQLNLDVLMLGALADPAAAGPYHAASRLAQLAALPLVAANVVLAGELAAAHAHGERARLQRLMRGWARRCTALAAVVLGLALLAGGSALQLFGPGFAGAQTALVVLAAGQVVNVACGSVALALSVTGQERAVLRGMALGAAANLALNLLLIPPLGPLGAALATAVSTALWNLVLARGVRRHLGVDPTAFGRSAC